MARVGGCRTRWSVPDRGFLSANLGGCFAGLAFARVVPFAAGDARRVDDRSAHFYSLVGSVRGLGADRFAARHPALSSAGSACRRHTDLPGGLVRMPGMSLVQHPRDVLGESGSALLPVAGGRQVADARVDSYAPSRGSLSPGSGTSRMTSRVSRGPSTTPVGIVTAAPGSGATWSAAHGARPVLVQALGSPWGGLQGARGFDVWIGPDGPSTDVSFPIVGVRGVPPEGFAHPSETRSAIVAWTSPVRGRVRISGSVSDGDPRGGDGVTWVLRKGLRTLAAGTLRNGAGRRPFGVSSVDVNAGEMLYLKGHSASLERLRLDDALAADR